MDHDDERQVPCPRCGRDVAYRLGFCSSCGETLPRDLAPTEWAEDFTPGQQVDDCEVLEPAAARPLGPCYRVRDLPSGRDAELRLVRPVPGLDAEQARCFLRVLEQAGHWRGTRGLRDVLRHEEIAGGFRVVLDETPGEPLDRDLVGASGAARALGREAASALLGTLCEALARLHEHTPHGQIWPGSIRVQWRGEAELARLELDLPGEIWLQPDPRTAAIHTVASAAYVAPELLAGEPPGVPADIYAVGVLAYQVLTGRLPRGQAPTPSALVPRLGPRVDEVVQRALAEQPGGRYSRIEDLGQDLVAALAAPAAAPVGPSTTPPSAVGSPLQDGATSADGTSDPRPDAGPSVGPAVGSAVGSSLGSVAVPPLAATRPRRRRGVWLLLLLLIAAAVAYWQRAQFLPAGRQTSASFLIVTTTPPRARVNLNGVDYGLAPVELVGVAPRASHFLRVTADGHQLKVVEVRLAPGERREIKVRLAPDSP